MKRIMCCVVFCFLFSAFAGDKNTEVVYASKFTFDPEDATKCLQAAIDSGAKKVIVENMGKPWIVRPLKLRSNQHILFKAGVVVEAKKDEFKQKNDCLFSGRNTDNLIMEGEQGAILRMRKKDYQDSSRYTPAEWRSVINLGGANHVTVRNLTLASSGGDGIYIGRTYGKDARDRSRNVLIENCVIDDHHRQGISVISVEGLTVRNCLISNTFGTEPQAGIDCETNYRDEYQKDILVENCTFRGNGGGGFVFASVSIHPVSATVRNCTFDKDYLCAIMISRGGEVPTTGKLRFENCKINVLVGNYPEWYGQGRPCTTLPVFYQNTGSGLFDVEFDNITVNAPDTPLVKKVSPISFYYTRLWKNLTGRNTFRNFVVNGFRDVPLVFFGDWTEKLSLKGLEGEAVFNGKKIDLASYVRENKLDREPDAKEFQVGKASLKELALPAVFPVKSAPEDVNPDMSTPLGVAKKEFKEGVRRPELRTNFKLYFLGKKGMEAKLRCNVFISMYDRNPVMAVLSDGKSNFIPLGAFKAGINEFKFTYPEDGIYMLDFKSRGCRLKLLGGENIFPSFGGTTGGSNFFSMMYCPPRYTGYFEVPADVKKFSLSVSGDPMEPTSFEIRDAKGNLVASKADFDNPTHFQLEKKSAEREVWSFTFINSLEDVKIRFHAPLSGIWAENPETLPILKRK